jgi:hypothetical protein
MKLVTALSTAALVLAPAVGLAQAPANGAGNTQDQPGLVNKVIGTITGRTPDTKEGVKAKSGDRDSAAKGDTNYPDRAAVKRIDAAPAAGLAQAPANGAGNTKGEPGVVEKAIGAITGRTPDTKEGATHEANKSGDRDSASKSAGDTNYPDFAKVKKTDK